MAIIPWADQTKQTPNKAAGNTPRFAVLHYTASSSFESTVAWLCDPKSRVSAHYLIGRDGKLAQLVDTKAVAWHVGQSNYNGYSALNTKSIGIEIVNLGPLTSANKSIVNGKVLPEGDVFRGKHRLGGSYDRWQKFTAEQLVTVERLLEDLFREHPTLKEVIEHADAAHFRGKIDCGPALDEFRVKMRDRFNRK